MLSFLNFRKYSFKNLTLRKHIINDIWYFCEHLLNTNIFDCLYINKTLKYLSLQNILFLLRPVRDLASSYGTICNMHIRAYSMNFFLYNSISIKEKRELYFSHQSIV